MIKFTDKLSAREYVWEHRIRQRIALERIILSVGNAKEKYHAKQFLDAMEQAYPDLLEAAEQLSLEELFEDARQNTPELFDESEYCRAKGRKTALKFPQDFEWEERVIKRAVREYGELFHPCENTFSNALKGLQYLYELHPKLFSKARTQAIEQRESILSCEIYCKCNCVNPDNSQPAASFLLADKGRFKVVSQRIVNAMRALEKDKDGNTDWQFFLDRIGEIAPEMTV